LSTKSQAAWGIEKQQETSGGPEEMAAPINNHNTSEDHSACLYSESPSMKDQKSLEPPI
jgi:hypothetical protein